MIRRTRVGADVWMFARALRHDAARARKASTSRSQSVGAGGGNLGRAALAACTLRAPEATPGLGPTPIQKTPRGPQRHAARA
eukprot:3928880-Pyramimonas_sp.AAC.1